MCVRPIRKSPRKKRAVRRNQNARIYNLRVNFDAPVVTYVISRHSGYVCSSWETDEHTARITRSLCKERKGKDRSARNSTERTEARNSKEQKKQNKTKQNKTKQNKTYRVRRLVCEVVNEWLENVRRILDRVAVFTDHPYHRDLAAPKEETESDRIP